MSSLKFQNPQRFLRILLLVFDGRDRWENRESNRILFPQHFFDSQVPKNPL